MKDTLPAYPGHGLPINHTLDKYLVKPIIDWSGTILTVRELSMLALMDRITDKPFWHHKVFEQGIVDKWRKEAEESDMDVSVKMLDWVSGRPCYRPFYVI